MRRGTRAGGVRCLGRDNRGAVGLQIVAHVGWQRAVAVVRVLHTVGTRHLSSWRHGHVCLGRRRGRHRGSAIGCLIGDLISLRVARSSRGRADSVGVPGQSLGRLSRGRLDGSGVVVLVTSKSGTASEGLLARGVGALVWPLARVDATVPSERTGITEVLQSGI